MTSHAIPVTRADTGATLWSARPVARARLAFIDNLRVLLVVLVIVHHVAVTYGGEGSWYYYEGQADMLTAMVLTLLVVINQAFFMGFYFAIAGYFMPRSLERKTSRQFLKERFLRLGVPLALQLLVMGPLLNYGLAVHVWGFDGSLGTYLRDYVQQCQGLDTGILWFIEALLIFSAIYALWWELARPPAPELTSKCIAPSNMAIAGFALAVGLVTFVVRIWLPVGWTFVPLNFQLPHFPQYISLFVVGAVAYRRGWLPAFSGSAARGKLWSRVAISLALLAPALFVAGGALEGNTAPFRGGIHWQALVYALWEQFMCVAIVITLLAQFRKRYDHQGTLARAMSASAYAVYVLHAPILVFVTLGLRGIGWHPLLKFALASLTSLPLCFLVGGLVRRLPLARRVL